MISLEEIKRQALEIKDVLSKCKTVGDVRNLRHLGISESDIQISVQEIYGGMTDLINVVDLMGSAEFYDCPQITEDTLVYSIRLDCYPDSNIDFPTYMVKSGNFYFDVFDYDVDDTYPFIEDATLECIDGKYQDFLDLNPEFAPKKSTDYAHSMTIRDGVVVVEGFSFTKNMTNNSNNIASISITVSRVNDKVIEIIENEIVSAFAPNNFSIEYYPNGTDTTVIVTIEDTPVINSWFSKEAEEKINSVIEELKQNSSLYFDIRSTDILGLEDYPDFEADKE